MDVLDKSLSFPALQSKWITLSGTQALSTLAIQKHRLQQVYHETQSIRDNKHGQGSAYWGGAGGSFPQKSFTEKKITAISNKDLF